MNQTHQRGFYGLRLNAKSSGLRSDTSDRTFVYRRHARARACVCVGARVCGGYPNVLSDVSERGGRGIISSSPREP